MRLMHEIVTWASTMWTSGSFVFIYSLMIGDFEYMYHHRIQFYDNISKLGHIGHR